MSVHFESTGFRDFCLRLPDLFDCACGVTPVRPVQNSVLDFRYSDFMVNEIDTSGDVVHLDNLQALQVTMICT